MRQMLTRTMKFHELRERPRYSLFEKLSCAYM
jgi:hypothetical protein